MTCRAAVRVGWGRLGNTHRHTQREAFRQTLPALSRRVFPAGSPPGALIFLPGCSLFWTRTETPAVVKMTREALIGKPWTYFSPMRIYAQSVPSVWLFS